MRPGVIDEFVRITPGLEGVVLYPYLDILGYVTIGWGSLIDPIGPAFKVPFLRHDGSKPTSAEVATEWHLVKECTCGSYTNPPKCVWPDMRSPRDGRPCLAHQGHRAAGRITSLRISAEGAEGMMRDKLSQNEAALRVHLPMWSSIPANAQLAMLLWAWAVGPDAPFPRLMLSVGARNWSEASTQVRIRTTGNPGIPPRNRITQALMLACLTSGPDEISDYQGVLDPGRGL